MYNVISLYKVINMAEPKKRKIVSASDAKKSTTKSTKPKKVAKTKPDKADDVDIVETSSPKSSGKKKSAAGLRTGAIILWVVAFIFQIVAIYMLNITETTFAIIAIILDAIACISGSLLWKKANRITPNKSKNKVIAFIWNQMGLIACLLCFIPLGLFLLLKEDKLSPKMKKIIAAIAAVAFLGSSAASIDYNPPTAESVALAEAEAAAADADFDGNVYWTRWGKSYHLDPDCHTLLRSAELITGTMEEAFEHKRNDPCDFCAGGADEE